MFEKAEQIYEDLRTNFTNGRLGGLDKRNKEVAWCNWRNGLGRAILKCYKHKDCVFSE